MPQTEAVAATFCPKSILFRYLRLLERVVVKKLAYLEGAGSEVHYENFYLRL